MTFKTDWVATYHLPRGYLRPLELDPAYIFIEDIQHALSNICRFNGHCREFYSVAQHSVHVSEWLARNGAGILTQAVGLLHDASEAYICDIPRPIKKATVMQPYLEMENEIQHKIYSKFLSGHSWDADKIEADLHLADDDILVSEAIQLFNIVPADWGKKNPKDYFHIKPISPRDAKLLFEDRFHELMMALEET